MFLLSKIVPTIVETTTVVIISKMKFQPMIPKMRKAPIFGNCSPTPLSKKGRKNIKQQTENRPVFTIGTIKLEIIKPKTWFLFLKSLNDKPASKPAIVVFNKQAMTVPAGLIGIKIANVEGENKAIMPLKKPTTAPESGPHIAAANTIVIKDKLMFTGPNCK